MRSEIEEEIQRRGGEFEVGVRDAHVFNGFRPFEKLSREAREIRELV